MTGLKVIKLTMNVFLPTAEPLYIMKHRGDVRTNADTVFQA